MIDYLITWGHAYLVHFGAWVSLALVATLHNNGVPKPNELPSIVLSAILLASIGSLFSSHSHTHYLQTLVKSVDSK